jgi:ribonuclease Z
VPGLQPGTEDEWRALAAGEFDQHIEIGDDLLRVEVHPGVCAKPAR